MRKYYSLMVNSNKEADVYIFGDIVEPTTQELFGMPADVSGFSLVQEIKDLEVNVINVHINSYGGHVSEGFAIYNELKSHKASIRTICEGFACSAASVVFMAGDERIMKDPSALFIHEVQSGIYGSADAKRKAADEDEKLTKISMQAYLSQVKIPQEKLAEMMKVETWISPQEAIEMGFATSIATDAVSSRAAASAKKALFTMLKKGMSSIQSAEVADEIVEKLYERLIAELKTQEGLIVNGAGNQEPTTEPTHESEPISESEPDPEPQQNKPQNLIAALFR